MSARLFLLIKPDGKLDGSSHVYKTIILDGNGKTITRHQIWLTTIKAYDNAIQAGRSDTIHYQSAIPGGENRLFTSI